ncbi:capsular biosynthesis protein [Altererythrobacter sp. SALINAS58]|uniref:capsular biosynthesis protein n=1 Tax=Alteripontixanthobacter muriae TaxID=2705546 RepID=UPI001574F8DA|nr:capsular biosynthesis protein [Alteripontixanthobacter muriae]NTZ41927.1 capsular biosynthesis protein [Alteripontixanthobacter muriae]
MTEHSNIPVPSADDQPDQEAGGSSGEQTTGQGQDVHSRKGASLFERASGRFGLDPFKPAALRRDLADLPKVRRKLVRPANAKAEAAKHGKISPALTASASEIEPPLTQAAETMHVEEAREPVQFPAQLHGVDRAVLAERGFIVPGGEANTLLEEFRIAKRQLLSTARALGTEKSRIVLISSPLPGEGKTFCSVNLALAMAAERNIEVLLVDGDVAKPSICSVLGIEGGPGLMNALADPETRVEDFVLRTDIDGLSVLPAGDAGTAGTGGTDHLASEKTDHIFERLSRDAPNRMIIIDSPPTLAASPAAEFAKHAGQTVLVARADRTGRSALEDAYGLLSACSDIKLLLNGADFSPSGRRFGTYHAGAD